MKLPAFMTNKSAQYFAIIVVYYAGLVVFMSGLLPMEDIAYKEQVAVHTEIGPVKRFIVMIVDGLRSDILFSSHYSRHWTKLQAHMQRQTSICSVSLIQPPTVTMPRIKAITSGRVPKFVDVLRNLDTSAMHGDTWLSRLVQLRKWTLEFYGDDTWIKLFPHLFRKSDGTNSFFVNDYQEVDRNVTRHLKSLFQRPSEWNGVILHYLGLDHIGHVEGPNGSSIPPKLKEMDEVVDTILTSMTQSAPFQNESWVFILTGDHGMSDQGGHGGSTLGEVTTGLILLSSVPASSHSLNTSSCSLSQPPMHSQQVDLATFMGLITGAGIPKSSLGLIPPAWLHTFWPDPYDRLHALTGLLRHYALLSGCAGHSPEDGLFTLDPKCTSNFVKQDEVILYNTLVKQIELKFFYMDRNEVLRAPDMPFSVNPTAPVSSAVLENYEEQMLNLLSAIQLRALNGAHQLDDFSMMIGALLMWAVTLFMWQRIAIQLLSPIDRSELVYSKRYDSSKTTSVELFSLHSAKLVSTIAAICLLLQTCSLGGSSFAEEEHQFWYYFSATLLVISAGLVGLGCPSWIRKRSGLIDLLVILVLDRVLLRRLHQTGSKWIHLPDLSDWLTRPEHSWLLWSCQIGAWLSLVVYRMMATLRCSEQRRSVSWCPSPVISILLVAVGQLSYRWAATTGQSEWAVMSARIVYCLLLADCFLMWYWYRRHAHSTSQLPSTSSCSSRGWTRVWLDSLHPVNTFPLLICLLGRPTVSLLWIGVVWKEWFIASVMQRLWDQEKWSDAHPSTWHLCCCWLFYWLHGWTTYFEQGNSISLATVDVSAAYVGLRTHQPLVAGFLLACYTYAGPLYWQLAYATRYALQLTNKQIGLRLAFFRLGFVILPLTFCATVCFILQSHLFIWTVFTPKLLYLATFQIVFAPVLILWSFNRA